MNEQAINNIKDALREMMQLLVQRGEPLSEELKAKIAQVMEHAANRITQLRQEEANGEEIPDVDVIEEENDVIGGGLTPPEEPPTQPPSGGHVPPLTPTPHPSSNINSFRYEPENQDLYIKFQDKFPGQNGPVYKYSGVPQNTFKIFQRGSVAPRTSGANAWHRWEAGKSPSHGASAYALIREGGFPFVRIS